MCRVSVLGLMWMGALAVSPEARADEPVRSAVVVGANRAPPGRAPLHFAHADARAVRDALVELAGFSPDRVTLLLDPDPAELLEAVQGLEGELGVLYYSGHADVEHLFPMGQELAVAELRDGLAATDATFRLGVLDTCRGGSWTGTKGVTEIAPFPVDVPSVVGVAYVAASSGSEDAHETDQLQGSVFTHHWLAGLRGAADADSDGVVTLSESFAHARSHTIRDSTALVGHAQHPSLDLQLQGRGDLVLADLRGARTRVQLDLQRSGVAVYDLDDGAHITDAEGGDALVLAPGTYLLRRGSGAGLEVAELEVQAGADVVVRDEDFGPEHGARMVAAKGDVQRAALDMAPRAGVFSWQVDMGSSVGPGVDGDVDRLLSLHSVLQVGLNDRVSLSLPAPGLGVRLGNPESHEALVFGGFYGGGWSLWPGPVAVIGDLGLGVDTRHRLGPGVAVATSLAVTTNSTLLLNGSRAYLGTSTGTALSGLQLDVGSHVTLYPAVGVAQGLGASGSTWLQLGSGLSRGSRHLPLLQVHLTNGVSLDADVRSLVNLEDGTHYEQTLLGVTLAFPEKRVGR